MGGGCSAVPGRAYPAQVDAVLQLELIFGGLVVGSALILSWWRDRRP